MQCFECDSKQQTSVKKHDLCRHVCAAYLVLLTSLLSLLTHYLQTGHQTHKYSKSHRVNIIPMEMYSIICSPITHLTIV